MPRVGRFRGTGGRSLEKCPALQPVALVPRPVGTGQPLAMISRQVNVNKLPELTPAKKYFLPRRI